MKKNFFITGGTGSFSRNFIKFILKKKGAKKIVIYSRDEFKQMQLKEIPEIKKNLNIFRFFIFFIKNASIFRSYFYNFKSIFIFKINTG